MNSGRDRVGEEAVPAPKPLPGYASGASTAALPLRARWNQLASYKRAVLGLSTDMLSLGASQVLAAIGQIIGVRLLTDALSPAVFGEVSLIIGVSVLATSILINPTMQALLRYYPQCAETGNAASVKRTAVRRIARYTAFALPLSIPLGILGLFAGWFSLTAGILLLILVAVDGMRMFSTTIMNASRQHHRYGIWQIGEAWGRPVLAYGATAWWGVHTEIVLAAFIVASSALYGFMCHSIDPRSTVPSGGFNEDDLMRKFENYARPLIPLGLLGWISGMADRYMIGSMLSVQDVGMYAAAYGLASRPMLMLSSIAETAIRPLYYSASARKDQSASRKYLYAWFGMVFAGVIGVCVLLALFHQQLVQILLGPGFRESSSLMPWIAAGYGLLAVYHISSRVCLVHDAPHAVTLSEAAGAISAVAIGFFLIRAYGALGAAMAVPIYYGVQLVVSVCLAVRSVRSRQEHLLPFST